MSLSERFTGYFTMTFKVVTGIAFSVSERFTGYFTLTYKVVRGIAFSVSERFTGYFRPQRANTFETFQTVIK